MENTIRRIKYKRIDREQLSWVDIDVDRLIGLDHKARLIWEAVSRLDVSQFEAAAQTFEEEGGRPAWPPELLISVWLYAYTLGVPSARALERMMSYEPGLRWLTGLEVINHHTLSSFRVAHGEALNHLFAQQLALLEQEGLVDWSVLMQDGTKVQARASKWSYHRGAHIRERVDVAREAIEVLDAAAQPATGEAEQRVQAAQRRAATERLARMEAALAALEERAEQAPASRREEVRVSVTEPDARKMKQSDGGWRLSYNVQTTTAAAAGKFVVGVAVTSSETDVHELVPALERIEQPGRTVRQVVADGGYVSRENVEAVEGKGIALVAPWEEARAREAGALKRAGIDPAYGGSQFQVLGDGDALECPQGKRLPFAGVRKHHGMKHRIFEANAQDCAGCPVQSACCGRRGGPRRIGRPIESPHMAQWIRRMQTDADAHVLYRQRKAVAEWPHLWIKSLRGLRRFSVWGCHKAGLEMVWAVMAYNFEQLFRLRGPAITA